MDKWFLLVLFEGAAAGTVAMFAFQRFRRLAVISLAAGVFAGIGLFCESLLQYLAGTLALLITISILVKVTKKPDSRAKLVVSGILLLVGLAASLIGAWTTVRLAQTQRSYVFLYKGTSYEQVVSLLGEPAPDDLGFGLYVYQWMLPDDESIIASFYEDGLVGAIHVNGDGVLRDILVSPPDLIPWFALGVLVILAGEMIISGSKEKVKC